MNTNDGGFEFVEASSFLCCGEIEMSLWACTWVSDTQKSGAIMKIFYLLSIVSMYGKSLCLSMKLVFTKSNLSLCCFILNPLRIATVWDPQQIHVVFNLNMYGKYYKSKLYMTVQYVI